MPVSEDLTQEGLKNTVGSTWCAQLLPCIPVPATADLALFLAGSFALGGMLFYHKT